MVHDVDWHQTFINWPNDVLVHQRMYKYAASALNVLINGNIQSHFLAGSCAIVRDDLFPLV